MYRPSLLPPVLLAIAACAVAACSRPSSKSATPTTTTTTKVAATADYPPVPVNPVSPVEYPAALLAQQIEGRVLLRLHVDSAGGLIADSSQVAESSGYPALDSAALAGARSLRFSPALHKGRPVALSFIQPVLFRLPRARGTMP